MNSRAFCLDIFKKFWSIVPHHFVFFIHLISKCRNKAGWKIEKVRKQFSPFFRNPGCMRAHWSRAFWQHEGDRISKDLYSSRRSSSDENAARRTSTLTSFDAYKWMHHTCACVLHVLCFNWQCHQTMHCVQLTKRLVFPLFCPYNDYKVFVNSWTNWDSFGAGITVGPWQRDFQRGRHSWIAVCSAFVVLETLIILKPAFTCIASTL